jgi:ring-1,2-phenylacetyl-CoA epoxidase subunit PaaC
MIVSDLFDYTLALADDQLVLGHRISEWSGRAPVLEEELALANTALDLIGQARSLYAYAGEVEGEGRSEDDLAYFRDAGAYRNLLLTELPTDDFAVSIARQLLYAAFMTPFWETLSRSADERLAAIAAKSVKETRYHVRHAAEWLIRLGDGTEESHARAQAALDELWPFTGELFVMSEAESRLLAAGIAVDRARLRAAWSDTVDDVLGRATLTRPFDGWMQEGGRTGRHTEHLGHMLAVMQSVARAHPGATW